MHLSASRSIQTLLLAGLVLGRAGIAQAQQAPTAALGAATTPTAPLGIAGSTQMVSDLFIGKNVVGPYMLSWKGIEAGSEIVLRNGEPLKRSVDYTLDPATGALTFTQPLRTTHIARVEYRYTPGKAAANTAATAVPMQFDLLKGGGDALTLNALFRPSATGPANAKNAGSSDGVMILGLGGNTQLGAGSSLTSKLFLDAHGGQLWQRSGMQLSEKNTTSFGQFSAGFARAGSGFAAGEETGLKVGTQILDAAGSLKPIHGFQASASFKQTTELPEQGKGGTVTVLGQKLTGNLTATTRLQATRTETTMDTPDGSSTTKVANRIQLDQKVDPHTQATALFESNETDAKDSHSVAQTNTVTVKSQPLDNLSVQGTYQNKLLPSGAEDAANIKLEATPTKQLKLSALIGERYNQKSSLHNREAGLAYDLGPVFSLSTKVQMRTEGANQALTTGVNAAVAPLKFMEVSGGVRLRDETNNGVPNPDVPDTYDVKLSLKLLNNCLKLTGGYTDNPEDDKGVVNRLRSRSVGLQSKMGALEFAGGYSLQDDYQATKLNTVLDLKLGLRLAPTTTITTGYKETQTQDSSLLMSDTYTLGFTHHVGSLFDLILNGSMTTYQKNGLPQSDSTDYKAEAKVGIRF